MKPGLLVLQRRAPRLLDALAREFTVYDYARADDAYYELALAHAEQKQPKEAAAALRENLKRRKQQARTRMGEGGERHDDEGKGSGGGA